MQTNLYVIALLVVALPVFFWRAWVGLKLNEKKVRRETHSREVRRRRQRASDTDQR